MKGKNKMSNRLIAIALLTALILFGTRDTANLNGSLEEYVGAFIGALLVSWIIVAAFEKIFKFFNPSS
tara:strand:- start:28879 stop:29082 length:204 start_codon:yes stop_codon:yes gene_type:complete